ncbi:MAG TPA: pitrilysin family protein [Myxococcota bacterium]|nr:pitrilysin family protein [Myxococcota bacterium]
MTRLAPLLLSLLALPASASNAWPDTLPRAVTRTLDNGLEVILVPNTNNPLLEVQLGFRVGSGGDSIGREGTASLLGRLATAGLGDKTEQALARELAKMGAYIAADVGLESFVLGGQVPTFDEATVVTFLELFAGLVFENPLPVDILEREKALRMGLLTRASDNAEALVEVAARMVALPGAWSRPTFGTSNSIPTITRDDLLFYRDRVFTPGNAVLVIGGAFDERGLMAWVERRFGAWRSDVSSEAAAIPGRPARLCLAEAGQTRCVENLVSKVPESGPRRTLLVTVDDPNLSQIPYRLATRNPVAMSDPRWPAFRLGTFVLGGDFTSRLNQSLRVREGLTYGAYFSPDFGGHASGAMMVSSDATPDALLKAISIATTELNQLASTPISIEELDMNRAMLVEGFAFKVETFSKTVEQYLSLTLAGLPPTWLAAWRTSLRGPDSAAVSSAMSVLDPKALSIIVAGPGSLEAELAKLGPVEVVSARDLLASGLPATSK